MRAPRLALAGILALAPVLCAAQTLVDKTYVFRTDSTVYDQYSGMTHMCVLLYPDGRYRREKQFQSIQGGNPETKVYLDTLPEPDLKAFLAILDDSQFQQVKTAPPRGGIIKEMDTLNVTVPREHSVQSFNFNNAEDRKPFEKTLKPFLDAMKKLEKRKVAVAKSEKSDNCAAPRVMYRSTFKPVESPSPDNEPQR